MTLGFLFGSKNFYKLLCVQAPLCFLWSFCLHGYDWIHWVVKSDTTIACRCLFRDSYPSVRTLWSAVIKSPKYSARSKTPPRRLLRGAVVILVFWQISQIRSFEKWISILCCLSDTIFSATLKMIRERTSRMSLCVQELFHPQGFLSILAAIQVFWKMTRHPVLLHGPYLYSVCGF